MRPVVPLFVVQLFDREGYYSCVLGATAALVRERVDARTKIVKQLVACSVPFAAHWSPAGMPDVSLPLDMRAAFAALERSSGEE